MTARPKRLRTAGSRWRVLVHEHTPGERVSGRAHDITSGPAAAQKHAEPPWTVTTVLPGTEFDELVVGRWIHVEQMDAGLWWMNVGGVVINVRADRGGRPVKVDVYGPGDYAGAEPGCRYSVTWRGVEGSPVPSGTAAAREAAS